MSEPDDDSSIDDDVDLWRRLPPNLDWIVLDRKLQARRVSSAAFQNLDQRNALSVCITCDAPPDFTPHSFVARHPGHGVAAITAGAARLLEQGVVRVLDPPEVAHGHIVGEKNKSTRKKLAAAARILIDTED